MKNYFLLLSSIIFYSAFAQELVSKVKLDLDKKTDLFEITDSKNKQILLYKRNQDVSTIYKLSANFELNDSVFFKTPNTKVFDQYLGHSQSKEDYSVYWTNNKRDSIFYQQIHFNDVALKNKTIRIDLRKEKFLKSITVGSKFYMLTMPKSGNSMTFHEFTDGNYKNKTIVFDGAEFGHSGDKNSTMISDVFFTDFGIREMSNDTPISLPLTQNAVKLYIQNEKDILFTFDGNAFFTQILKINTDDFTYSLQDCFKSTTLPQDELESLSTTNSIICNDKIFQIIANSEYTLIDIKNMNFETLKSFKIEKDKEIDFLNSEIIQENLTLSNKRVLGKSTQLVRKLSDLHLGITCDYKDNKYHLTIGGFSDVQNNNAMIYGGMFGIAGALIAISLTPSYTMQNIDSYRNRRVVYVKSILNENFNHVEGNVQESAFDKLRLFTDLKADLKYPLAFKFDQTIYFGGYDKNTKLFSLYKFND